MLEGAHLGGVALATVDMGLHHGTGHVLGGSAGVPHGVANCIVLPHAVVFNADALHRFIAKLGQPQRLRDARVAREQLPALANALLASNAAVNNPRPLKSHEEALSYLEDRW